MICARKKEERKRLESKGIRPGVRRSTKYRARECRLPYAYSTLNKVLVVVTVISIFLRLKVCIIEWNDDQLMSHHGLSCTWAVFYTFE